MKPRNIKPLPFRQDILDNVSTDQIFVHYIGKLPIRPISSPLREGDENPSFSVFFSETQNQWLYKDYGTDEVGDAFVFVKRKFNLSKLTDTYCKIAADFGLTQFQTREFTTTEVNVRRKIFKPKQPVLIPTTTISVRRRNWSKRDADYWTRIGLHREQLEACGVFPISHFFINRNGYDQVYTADVLAYAYTEAKDGVITYKIYQPRNRSGVKWKSNNNSSVWELWEQMPDKGDILIIASSRKDAMVIKSLFPSYKVTSVALQSEGVEPKGTVIAELKNRFKRVYCLFDADTKGERSASKLEAQYGIKKLSLGYLSHEGKDVAEWRAGFGGKRIRQEIINQIKLHPNACNDIKPF